MDVDPSTSAAGQDGDDDEVVQEFDVVLSKDIGSRLYQVQYPLRRADMPFAKETNINARFKSKVEMLEMKVALNTKGTSYCKMKGEQIASTTRSAIKAEEQGKAPFGTLMDYQTLNGVSALGQAGGSYVVGIVKDGVLHITPVAGSFEMRPSFSYLDSEDKKAKNEQEDAMADSATDSESEAAGGSQTIRPRFAREETEQSRKRREASSQHRQKLADEDPWIALQFVRSSEAESSQKRAQISGAIERRSSASPTFESDPGKVLEICIPQSTEDAVKAGELPSSLVPMAHVRKLTIDNQVAALLAKAYVLNWSKLMSLLPEDANPATVVSVLPKYASLVQGCWVLRSEFVHPKGTVSGNSGAPSESLCRARDFVLYRMHKSQSVTRKEVCDALKMSEDDVMDVMNNIGRPGGRRTWLFRLDHDPEFIQKFPEVAKQQEHMWEMKWAEMRQYLLDTSKAATQRKHNRVSSTSRRRRNTSTRSSISISEPVDIKQEIIHNDYPHSQANGDLSPTESTGTPAQMSESTENGSRSSFISPSTVEGHIKQFVYEKLADRRVIALSDLRQLLTLKISESPKGHVLAGVTVTDSALAEQVAAIGAVSLGSKTLGEPVYAYGETGSWPEARRAAIQLLQTKDKFRFATYKNQCAKQMSELPSDDELKKIISDYCTFKSGLYNLKTGSGGS
uniref:DNA-directed RNA polymerase III subunit RPC5 C-terminal domain-containing protein n=1 Tax=Plectus sambesii TaxID=2011161 RepID=A0A914WZC4_9BILA